VDHLLKPIFDYVPLSGDSPPPAPKHITAASAKPRTAPTRGHAAVQNHVEPPARPAFPRQTGVAQTHFPEPIYSQQSAPPMPDSDEEEASVASGDESDGSTTQSSHSRTPSLSSSPRASSDDEYVGTTNGRKRKRDDASSRYEHQSISRPISKYSQDLLEYFVNSKVDDLPPVLLHPPADFDVNAPIDEEGHTALHWAAAMGRITVVRILCELKADIFLPNNEDQIPLVRSIMFTNNFDNPTFTDLIAYLRPSITHRNKLGRTIFHQIAHSTSHRSKWPASKYYLENLIKDLCGQSTQEQLQRLKLVLDYQDVNGDTAITICARNQARKFCRLLIRANADIRIPNHHGRTAEEYIQEYESQRNQKRMLRNGIPTGGYLQSSPLQQQPHSASYVYPAALPNTAFPQRPANTRGFQTYISETAIRATQKVIPQITEQLEALANSFDAELVDKEADLNQAKHLLSSMEIEIETSKTALTEMIKLFQEVDPSSAGSEDVVSTGESVLSRIKERVDTLTKNLKMVVERGQARDLALLVREEEQVIPADGEKSLGGMEEQMVLANELTELQAERRALVDRIVDIYATSGCGEKMVGYRRLISLSTGQRMDQIDGLLEQLYQMFSEDEQSQQGQVESEDVVMTGTE
jgi:transcription factor MBP1